MRVPDEPLDEETWNKEQKEHPAVDPALNRMLLHSNRCIQRSDRWIKY